MATERELKSLQEAILYDLLSLIEADDSEIRVLLDSMFERAQSGMTAEEIDAVRERVARARKRRK
ncbi:MAG: hypothetical protein FWC67_01170 [Defluviitaleaceae bacterium]|nr:hypothetical protein [Defluviitaleaceae bacterium]